MAFKKKTSKKLQSIRIMKKIVKIIFDIIFKSLIKIYKIYFVDLYQLYTC